MHVLKILFVPWVWRGSSISSTWKQWVFRKEKNVSNNFENFYCFPVRSRWKQVCWDAWMCWTNGILAYCKNTSVWWNRHVNTNHQLSGTNVGRIRLRVRKDRCPVKSVEDDVHDKRLSPVCPLSLNGTNISELQLCIPSSASQPDEWPRSVGEQEERAAWGVHKSIEDVVNKTTSKHLFNSTILPVLTYGSET